MGKQKPNPQGITNNLKNPIDLFTPDIQRGYLEKVMDMNKGKNFIDRILNRDKYPYIPIKDKSGKETGGMTHKMASGSANIDGQEKFTVYPEIIYDKKTKQLNYLDRAKYGDQAWQYAAKNKEFMQFDNPEEAEWVAKNYKMLWKK